jgi:RNA polymerase sigma-70 factor (ECF subfamily)
MATSTLLRSLNGPLKFHRETILATGRWLYDRRTDHQTKPSNMAEPSCPQRAASKAGSVQREGDAESSFALLLRARTGDDRAREELFSRYLPRLQRWAHGRLPAWARSASETGDLVQDTLFQVIQKLDTFQPQHEGAFCAYVYQALLNRIRDEIRRAQRRGPFEPLDSSKPTLEPSPLERAIGQDALHDYEEALQRLKEDDRQAIILRIELGMSVSEVAQALGKPSQAAAHMAISRALVRLTKEMSYGPR